MISTILKPFIFFTLLIIIRLKAKNANKLASFAVCHKVKVPICRNKVDLRSLFEGTSLKEIVLKIAYFLLILCTAVFSLTNSKKTLVATLVLCNT